MMVPTGRVILGENETTNSRSPWYRELAKVAKYDLEEALKLGRKQAPAKVIKAKLENLKKQKLENLKNKMEGVNLQAQSAQTNLPILTEDNIRTMEVVLVGILLNNLGVNAPQSATMDDLVDLFQDSQSEEKVYKAAKIRLVEDGLDAAALEALRDKLVHMYTVEYPFFPNTTDFRGLK